MHDETEGGAWTGDIGYQCGKHWYHYSESAGSIKEGGEDFIPRCTWLDEDHTNGKPSAAMKFKTTAYGKEVKDTLDKKRAVILQNGVPIRDLSLTRQAWMDDRLVVSNITQHSTEELCSSETAWGPDFIGSDGYFCDMSSKTLIPICSKQNVDGCINLHDNDKAITKRSAIAKRVINSPHKSYGVVTHWD
ncbi:hypothetical protein LLEC1_00186 [Akanthomyces lecanii]|uniref:Uncharacterized protein n=1 Tax=Cordyceps confragosa TaxID=2714763 RepID=A0A179IHI5_CORDF|nr:hypothetical protein LLEC1_00186 [Akanthomyces lecanii]